MDSTFILLIVVIFFALAFDFVNGFHDAANSISTIVSTRVLKPHWAVIWAAFFNFIAFLFFHANVATTIGAGLISPSIIDARLIFSALSAAVIWNLITWYYALPSSSSHALIGGLLGAAIIKSGFDFLIISGIVKVFVSIILSPLSGFILAFVLMIIVIRIFFNVARRKVDKVFRKLQIVSASLFSLGHGGNDAQKTMGIIAALLFSYHKLGPHFYVPLWVIISCNLVMGLGTLFGGWRIVKTMGTRITRLKPVHGFCAETTAAATLFVATDLGIPVSTSHTIAGAVIGVGTVIKPKSVRWHIAGRMVWAWFLTLPIAAIISAIIWLLLKYVYFFK